MKRPIYLGSLIYAYSREYMYDTIISNCPSIAYQDTDSGFIDEKCYKKFIELYPNI